MVGFAIAHPFERLSWAHRDGDHDEGLKPLFEEDCNAAIGR